MPRPYSWPLYLADTALVVTAWLVALAMIPVMVMRDRRMGRPDHDQPWN